MLSFSSRLSPASRWSLTACFALAAALCLFTHQSSAATGGAARITPDEPSGAIDLAVHAAADRSPTLNTGDALNVRRLSSESSAEQIFQSDAMSARSVASFARNSEPIGRSRRALADVAAISATSESADAVPASAALRGDFLTETIDAFRSDAPARRRALAGRPGLAAFSLDTHKTSANARAAETSLDFWKDTKSAGFGFDADAITPDVSVAGASAENVPIPLPPAAWSALSVLAGMGLFTGVREWRRRRRLRV